MTESNFATSSIQAAVNIVLTVSMILVWSAVTGFCWALAVTGFTENMNAKTVAVRARCSGDGKEGLMLG
jgi:hypothetical protein